MQASLLFSSENILAEGPFWHAKRQSFFWVDIDGKSLHEYAWPEGETNRWQLDKRPSLIVECYQDDRLLLGLQGGIAYFDLKTGTLEWLLDLEKSITNNRTNDGGCDAAGRLWIGTMDRQCVPGKGTLYTIDPDLQVTTKIESTAVSNGIVWSKDGSTMYYIDSPTQAVKCFLFDKVTGQITNEKIAIRIDKEQGSPDGMCMDEEGMLWIAQWGGSGIYRYNPITGKLLDKMEVPAPQVSSCAFGGKNMEQLFITTAKENMSAEDLAKYPLSGNVFIGQPGVRGMPVHKFGNK